MSNIYELVYNTLIQLGYPVREQGTYGENETLPETFITYQIINEINDTHYDNKIASTTITVQLALYSKKPAIKQSADQLFRSVMLNAGFLRISGRDLPFNSSTGHYAYTSDYIFYKEE